MNDNPGNAEKGEGRPKKKSAGRKWLRRLLYAIFAIPVVAVGLLLFAGTGPALRLVMPTIEQAVSAAIDGRFAAKRIQGSLWTGLTLDSLSLAIPATGLAVEGQQMELQWSPLALLTGAVKIDRLAAAKLTVALPHRPGPEVPPEEEAGGPFALPLSIRLEQLDLPRLDIADPRSGRRFSSTLAASGGAGKRAAELTLTLTPREEDLDRLTVDLAFRADPRELRAEIDGRFHRTGMVMTLAGLSPEEATDIAIALKGEGPAEGWQGRLQLAAADLAELAGDLGLQLGRRQLGFSFSGEAGTLGRLAAELPRQLQGKVDIGLAGRYEMEAEILTFTRLALEKPDLLTVSATADLDLAADHLTAALKARIDAAASSLIEDAVRWQELRLQGEAKGKLAMPDLHLTLGGREVAAPAFSTRDLSLSVQSTVRGDRLAVTAEGSADGNDWTETELATILGDRLDVALKANIAEDFQNALIENLDLAAAGLKLSGRAGLDNAGRVTGAAATADIADLAIFSSLAGMELRGAGRLAVKNGSRDAAGGGRAEIEIAAEGLGLGQADLDRLVGTQPSLAGQVELSPRQDLAVKLDRVDLAGMNGPLSFVLADDFTRMKVDGELTVLPGALPPGIGVEMAQSARLAVQLEGPPAAPAGEIRLTVPTLSTGGERFDDLALTSSMHWSDEAVLSLENRLDFTLHQKPYQLQAEVTLPPDRLRLDRLALRGDAIELAGHLELPDYGPPMRGTVNLTRLDAPLLQDWAAPLAAGEVTGKVDFLPADEKQRINLEIAAAGIRLADGSGGSRDGLDRITLRGHVTDAFGQPVFELRSTASKFTYGQTSLDRFQATLRGPLAKLRATVETAGKLQARDALPVNLSASAEIALTEDIRLEFDRLSAGIGPETISLRRPFTLARTAAGAVDGSGALAIGAKGRLDVAFSLVPEETVSATAELSGVALGPWDKMFARQGLTGTLSLSADLTEQAGQAAQARLSATAPDLRLADVASTTKGSRAKQTPQLPPLALQLEAGIDDGRLDADISLGGSDLQVLTAQATLPLTVSVLRGRYDLDPRAPLDVKAQVDAEIARIWPYVPLPDHSLAGQLKLTADLSGSVAEPALDGAIQLQGGRYEHLQFGTLLQNIRIDGRLDSRGVHVTEIRADDGGKGSLAGQAEIEIGGIPPVAYRATVVMRDMAVTRMDELQLFADIDLNLEGDDRKAALKGEAKVNRGEVDLAVALPASVPQLEVANLRDAEEQGAEKKEEREEVGGFTADLQLSVDIPGQLFVRGKGLDSEWGGHLDIEGPADSPRIVGKLQARRGQLEVIGKTFAIRDSQLTFLGGQPPDPQLDIVGVHKAGDLEVSAKLSGTASKTQLTLSSDPQLPQDEILSRILFGKSQGRLSPYEAVQLAGVAADLTGKSGGFDIMGSLRKFLRVDVLRVEGGENGPGVEVGKYLTEGVYVGTKRGSTADTTGVEVEIELTPHIKATSESNEIDNKAGLQFKWDY